MELSQEIGRIEDRYDSLMQRLDHELLTTRRIDGTKEICGLAQSLISMGSTLEARKVCDLLIATSPRRRHATTLSQHVVSELESLCVELARTMHQ